MSDADVQAAVRVVAANGQTGRFLGELLCKGTVPDFDQLSLQECQRAFEVVASNLLNRNALGFTNTLHMLLATATTRITDVERLDQQVQRRGLTWREIEVVETQTVDGHQRPGTRFYVAKCRLVALGNDLKPFVFRIQRDTEEPDPVGLRMAQVFIGAANDLPPEASVTHHAAPGQRLWNADETRVTKIRGAPFTVQRFMGQTEYRAMVERQATLLASAPVVEDVHGPE